MSSFTVNETFALTWFEYASIRPFALFDAQSFMHEFYDRIMDLAKEMDDLKYKVITIVDQYINDNNEFDMFRYLNKYNHISSLYKRFCHTILVPAQWHDEICSVTKALYECSNEKCVNVLGLDNNLIKIKLMDPHLGEGPPHSRQTPSLISAEIVYSSNFVVNISLVDTILTTLHPHCKLCFNHQYIYEILYTNINCLCCLVDYRVNAVEVTHPHLLQYNSGLLENDNNSVHVLSINKLINEIHDCIYVKECLLFFADYLMIKISTKRIVALCSVLYECFHDKRYITAS